MKDQTKSSDQKPKLNVSVQKGKPSLGSKPLKSGKYVNTC